jgi:meso-butanediol dehydrogenase / (S,S)-butanediol dehydrogenase / diacetyl reductase
MKKSFDGKVVIISGGGSGIGLATAKRFSEEGCKVMVCGRREQPLIDITREIEGSGGAASYMALDVTDEESVRELILTTANIFGGIDVLVHNAATMLSVMLEDHTDENWKPSFDASTYGAMYLMREAYPYLKSSQGSIVTVGSISALYGSAAQTAYSAAKGALIAMTRSLAIEWAPDKIRANVVIPGVIATDMVEGVLSTDELKDQVASIIPLQLLGNPQDCANAIAFLASVQASYITGTTLTVDGGLTATINLDL